MAERRRRRRRPAVVAAVGAAALVVTAGVAVVAVGLPGADVPAATPGSSASSGPDALPAPRTPEAARAAFLDDWVDDGRVVRRDQGGDTVSEGQAYGLLTAVAHDDEAAFDRIWEWTRDELVRPDGLLAWRWDDGRVVDAQPASDADLDAARALVLAGDRFARPDLREAGVELGDRILDDLTAETAAGRILLPGPWAQGLDPLPYNPSYASPGAVEVLRTASDDPRWAELAAGSTAVTAALLEVAPLPSDWARVGSDGSVSVAAGASDDATGPVVYSFDAARMPVRFAESCSPDDRALAARLLPALRTSGSSSTLDLGGAPQDDGEHTLAAIALAGAAGAAGDGATARAALGEADSLAQRTPGYYAAAWAALGPVLLTDDTIGGCPPVMT